MQKPWPKMSWNPLNKETTNLSEPLEKRFTQPDGWVSGMFTSETTGHHITYGHVQADNPKGYVVLLGGLSEFSEKYYETARDFLKRDLSVYTMDWFGQGASGRYLQNPHKRHSYNFDHDIKDLHAFINTIVTPQNRDNLPVILCAHSMGAHIVLRYTLQEPNTFAALALTAPMIDIHGLRYLPYSLCRMILWCLKPFHKSYVIGGGDWNTETRNAKKNNLLSSDPIRREIHEYWSTTKQNLRIGSPTFGWVNAATQSCNYLQSSDLNALKTPILITLAGDEKLVDNAATRKLFCNSTSTTMIEINGAKHEILMERDEFRDQFWQSLDKMLEENKIFQ